MSLPGVAQISFSISLYHSRDNQTVADCYLTDAFSLSDDEVQFLKHSSLQYTMK